MKENSFFCYLLFNSFKCFGTFLVPVPAIIFSCKTKDLGSIVTDKLGMNLAK